MATEIDAGNRAHNRYVSGKDKTTPKIKKT